MCAVEQTPARTTGNPGEAVAAGVERILELAQTWLAWDGRPRLAVDGVRLYTPNKAIRRHADHLAYPVPALSQLVSGGATSWPGSA